MEPHGTDHALSEAFDLQQVPFASLHSQTEVVRIAVHLRSSWTRVEAEITLSNLVGSMSTMSILAQSPSVLFSVRAHVLPQVSFFKKDAKR